MSPIYLFTLVLLAATGLLTFWRGGAWERTMAVALAIAWIISDLAPFDYRTPPWAAIGADAAVFMWVLYGLLRSGRRWMSAAAAFQFLVLATHFVFATRADLEQWAYVSAYYVWTIGVIASLCAGALQRPRASSERERPQRRA